MGKMTREPADAAEMDGWTRSLRPDETRFTCPGRLSLRVIDIAASSASAESGISRLSASLREMLVRDGAILVRGGSVVDEAGFARVVAAIAGQRAMSGYFMRERGRTHVAGSPDVFHTNALMPTGGGFV